MSNAEVYLNTFNQLEQYLRSAFDATIHIGFKRLVDKLSQTDTLVALYKQDLIEFVELRNAIVHRSTGEIIAEPNDGIVKKIQDIYQKLVNPPLARDIATKPVFTCDTSEPIADLVRTMRENNYAYIPVYEAKQFVGVFSENSLTKWLASIASDQGFAIRETTVGELRDFFDDIDNKYNAYRFVPQDVDAFSVRESFISYMSKTKRLAAVYLTESGSPTEPIVGIITAWDIHKLSQFVQPTQGLSKGIPVELDTEQLEE